MVRLAEEVGLVVGDERREAVEFGFALGVEPEELVVVAQRLEVQLTQPRLEPRLEDLATNAVEGEAEAILDQVRQQLPFRGLEPAHAGIAAAGSASSALRAVRATTGSTSRTRVSSAGRHSGSASMPEAPGRLVPHVPVAVVRQREQDREHRGACQLGQSARPRRGAARSPAPRAGSGGNLRDRAGRCGSAR